MTKDQLSDTGVTLPVDAGLLGDRLLDPWISRFLWSPAADLHPSRREALLSGWPERVWSEPAALRHISRHQLESADLLEPLDWGNELDELRIVLLPQAPLSRLARRIGLALHASRLGDGGHLLDDDESIFVEKRAPLYWRVAAVANGDPLADGWEALRIVAGVSPGPVRVRFEWKTPAAAAPQPIAAARDALYALACRILKEFEPPWCSLFARPPRTAAVIRLRG